MATTQEHTINPANLPSGADGTHPAKSVLKEAVDAVLNSFAKHTHGYGRGKLKAILTCLFKKIIPNIGASHDADEYIVLFGFRLSFLLRLLRLEHWLFSSL